MDYLPLALTLVVCFTIGFAAQRLNSRRQRQQEQRLAKATQLSLDALIAETNRLGGRVIPLSEIPADSELGRVVRGMIARGGSCRCPNCSEDRRIAHARKNAEAGE